jgi:hypothetical protein
MALTILLYVRQSWLSCFPDESETLFPPLTFLQVLFWALFEGKVIKEQGRKTESLRKKKVQRFRV